MKYVLVLRIVDAEPLSLPNVLSDVTRQPTTRFHLISAVPVAESRIDTDVILTQNLSRNFRGWPYYTAISS